MGDTISVTYQLQVEVETEKDSAVLEALRALPPECLPSYVLDIRVMDVEKDIGVTGEGNRVKYVGYDGNITMGYDTGTKDISRRIVKAAMEADPEAHVNVRWWNLDVSEPVDDYDDECFYEEE